MLIVSIIIVGGVGSFLAFKALANAQKQRIEANKKVHQNFVKIVPTESTEPKPNKEGKLLVDAPSDVI